MREALELEAIAREREGRYELAISLYEAVLDTDPDSEVTTRIESRLEGLRTMRSEPREPLPAPRESAGSWQFRGSLHQYYWRDELEIADLEEDFSHEFLGLARNGARETIRSRIDARLLNDLAEDRSESRVARADLSYATREYEIIGGRQQRTVTGAPGRFDGFTFRHFVFADYRLSYFLGTDSGIFCGLRNHFNLKI